MVDEVGEERDEVEEWVRGFERGSKVTCNYHRRVVGFIVQNMQYSKATMRTRPDYFAPALPFSLINYMYMYLSPSPLLFCRLSLLFPSPPHPSLSSILLSPFLTSLPLHFSS